MFDTIAGLPIHALVVHGVVVLLPLMAVATLWWATRPDATPRVGWLVVAANAAVAAMTFVAKLSGQALQDRLSQPGAAEAERAAADHEQIARLLPFIALALLFASVLVQALRTTDVRTPRGAPAGLTAVVVVVALVWTFRTGHSGAEAVWGEIVKNTGK